MAIVNLCHAHCAMDKHYLSVLWFCTTRGRMLRRYKQVDGSQAFGRSRNRDAVVEQHQHHHLHHQGVDHDTYDKSHQT